MDALILCVECNKKSESDKKYIDNVIKNFYHVDTSIKICYVNFSGKGNYQSNKVTNAIKSIKSQRHFSKVNVIYCVDVDKIQADADANMLNEQIKEFCKRNNYEFVWFCENIEEVFLHKKVVGSREKQSEAKKVGRENSIGKATIESLSATVLGKEKSNLMLVLNKCLKKRINQQI